MNQSYDFAPKYNNGTNETNWNVSYTPAQDEIYVPSYDIPPLLTFTYIIVGTIGNLLVCLAIYFDRKLQNLTNYFLLSLAVTDLLVNVLILPGRLLTVNYMFKPSTFPLCFLYLIGDDYVTAASCIHICFISLERYFAIKNPLNQMNMTKTRVAWKIGLVWLLSFITIIPYMTSAIMTKHEDHPDYCANLLSNFVQFDTILFVEASIIVIMVVVVVVSFILTTLHLNKLVKKQLENAKTESGLVRTVGGPRNDDKATHKKALQNEEKALRVVWLVSFAFIICMVPYTCTSFSYFFFPTVIIPPILLEITAYFSYANSVINPIIYTIFNRTFRNDFKNIILFRFKKSN